MIKIHDVYFAWLRAALWGEKVVERWSAEGKEQLLHLCMHQGTGPLIVDRLLKVDDAPCTMPDDWLMPMKQVCMQNMMLQEQMRVILQKAVSALSEGGVYAVVLKGFALAIHYPQMHCRQWGDIDIYVGNEGYHQTAEILRMTFPNCPCYEEEEEYFKHWNVNVGNTAIEAHRVSAILLHPGDNRLWHRLETEAMRHAVELDIEGTRLRVPEEKWNILFVFLHSWQHYTESHSAKMQQFCDLALLLHHAQDKALGAYLRTNLRQLRLTQIWQAYAYILVQYLGLPADECPLYTPKAAKRGERLLQRLLEGREQVGHAQGSVPTNIVRRKLYTLRHKIADSLQTWELSPVYTIHDIMGKVLEGLSRLVRGEINRKWE